MDQEQMAAWMKYANPGEKHAYLKKLEGKWTGKAKFWMQPGAPPTESEGTAVNTLILGGRFLQSSYTSEVMGQPFEGFGLDGYDIHKQKYIGLWTDTMATKMLGRPNSRFRFWMATPAAPCDGPVSRARRPPACRGAQGRS